MKKYLYSRKHISHRDRDVKRILDSHVLGWSFILSLLAVVVTYFTSCSISLSSAILLYPWFFFFSIPLFRSMVPLLRKEMWILGLMFVWFLLVELTQKEFGLLELKRAIMLLFYLLFYGVSYIKLRYNNRYSLTIWKYILASVAIFVVIANLTNTTISISPYHVSTVRYEGITGPNFHGIVSVVGCFAVIALFSCYRSIYRYSYVVLFLYFLANLWSTGSRASLLSLFTYIIIIISIWHCAKKPFCLVLVFVVIVVGGSYTLKTPFVRQVLRLGFDRSGYSIEIRLRNALWACNMMADNSYLPYGLERVKELTTTRPLDNVYLLFGLEMGGVGLLLLLLFIVITMASAIRIIIYIVSEKNMYLRSDWLACCSVATFVSLSIHGLFEVSILTGVKITTLLFLLSAAHIHVVCDYLQGVRINNLIWF